MRVMGTVLSGGSRFFGAWSLDSFGDPLEKKKEYKITNTKLDTTLNIYLEWGKNQNKLQIYNADR